MKFILPVSLLSGLLLTLIFSLATATVSGRNIESGERFEVHHWDAISLYVSQLGLTPYLLSVLPAFIGFAAVTGISLVILKRKKQRAKSI
ncbi:hypothetical protein ACQUQU_16560 [Thalassolituus sp. LLYu03]|uniref:hypothetical protein n=1 Tax=Thalassolituus sp. LLYu03 TaxID=3421656 RepID=UPI003D26E339